MRANIRVKFPLFVPILNRKVNVRWTSVQVILAIHQLNVQILVL